MFGEDGLSRFMRERCPRAGQGGSRRSTSALEFQLRERGCMPDQLKEFDLWDEDYFKNLPNDESDWLDFKGSDWLTKLRNEELSKYVSAFANYDGGYLVIGVKDPKPGNPIELDEGVPVDPRKNLQNQLEQIISCATDPPISRQRVKLFCGDKFSFIKPGRCVVGIHIPPSDAAPHQAKDGKYYERTGANLRPIRHQAVMDIVNRRRDPVVETKVFVHFDNVSFKHNVFCRIENKSKVLARHVCAKLHIPTVIRGQQVLFPGMRPLVLDSGACVWPLVVSNRGQPPLFPYDHFEQSFDFKLECEVPTNTIPHIWCRTFADNMVPDEEIIIPDDKVVSCRNRAV